MKVHAISVGTKMPGWVQSACDEYLKRLGSEMPLDFIEIPLIKRSKSNTAAVCVQKEGEQILSKIPKNCRVIALEVLGKAISTQGLAKEIGNLRESGQNLCLLIGGPDGLSEACRNRADQQWSLSELTLPHPLVRVIVAEQFYRAVCILKGHPYHRA